jgi:hypothetical protein
MIKRLNSVNKDEMCTAGYFLRMLWDRHVKGLAMHANNVYGEQHEQYQKANRSEFEKKHRKGEIGFRKNESGIWGVYSDLLYDTYQKDWSKAYQLTFYCFFRNIDFLCKPAGWESFSCAHDNQNVFIANDKECQFGEIVIEDVMGLVKSGKADKIHGLPMHSKAPLYDIISGVLEYKKYPEKDVGRFRHGHSYWLGGAKDGGEDFPKRLAMNFFAHMASAAVVNPLAFKAMSESLSNSHGMFMDALKCMALCLGGGKGGSSGGENNTPKAKDITEKFIFILKQKREEVKELKSIVDTPIDHKLSVFISDQILYDKLIEMLYELSETDIKLVLSRENKEELKNTPRTFFNFYKKVKPDGPWDLKKTEFANSKDQYDRVIISGKYYKVDVTGNVLFGYAGAALGFSEEILLKMAGLAQKHLDMTNPKTGHKPQYTLDSYWDDPRDQEQISAGVALYKFVSTSQIELNATFLDKIFTDFNPNRNW